jgi:hypothetical protein
LKNGIKGIAILPTYSSNVTLAESNPYVCFIDYIDINDAHSGISSDIYEAGNIYYANGQLFFTETQAAAKLFVYDLSGILVKYLMFTEGTNSIPLQLENKPYIVKIQQTDGKTYQRAIYPQ